MDANGIFEIKPKYKKVGDEQSGLDLLAKVTGPTQEDIEKRHQQQNMERLPRTQVNLTITSILSYSISIFVEHLSDMTQTDEYTNSTQT